MTATERPPDTFTAALAWASVGCSVVPVTTDGTKAPDRTWKQYQTQPATPDQLRNWFADGHPGLGVICGTVSGNLEMLEFEGRAVTENLIPAFAQTATDTGHADTWATVSSGCAVMSPSHGLHLYYRVTGGVDGNTKLASRHATDDELTPDETQRLTRGKRAIRVLIETRGEGGFVVAPPSHGPVHPTGRPWRFITGDPTTIPTITAGQRDALHIISRSLDQLPAPEPIPEPTVLDTDRTTDGGVAPGTDYNQRGSWQQLLTAHGWRLVSTMSTPNRQYWTRPGKTYGVSAVTGGDHDYFWCWSSSTELPTEQAMSKWRVYAHLEHNGDFHAAAKALKQQGYGQNPPPPTRPVFTVLSGPRTPVDGNNARLPQPHPETSPVTLAHSDDANALALVEAYGDRIRYCPERGRWLHWTGHKWQWCPPGGGVVREHAKSIARVLPDDDTTATRHKQRALSAIGTTAMITQAATDERVVVNLADLDAHLYELNTPTGIIDLRDGTLHPADPTHLHTRITTATLDTTADPTRWLDFLTDTFTGHEELPDYLQRLIGYAATGVVRDHVLPFCFGAGANGKGVFLETIRAVLGDYATTAPSGFLMAKNYAGHETEIARLAGARMVVCSEINETDRFDEAKVKQLTGGDTLTARFMRMDHFTFTPTHKLWLMGNHQPTVTGGGQSFWRRLRIVPFLNTVPEDKRVDDLQGILATQDGGAILAWIVTGAAAYFASGLKEPESVRAATEEYANDQDTVNRFVEENCHLSKGGHDKTRVNTVREAYEHWCSTEGETPVKPRTFGLTLRTRFGITTERTNRHRFYVGLSLLADEDTDNTPHRKDLD